MWHHKNVLVFPELVISMIRPILQCKKHFIPPVPWAWTQGLFVVLGLRERNNFILKLCNASVYTHSNSFFFFFKEILPFLVLFGLPPFLSGSVLSLLLFLRIQCVVRVTWGSGNQPCWQLVEQKFRISCWMLELLCFFLRLSDHKVLSKSPRSLMVFSWLSLPGSLWSIGPDLANLPWEVQEQWTIGVSGLPAPHTGALPPGL